METNWRESANCAGLDTEMFYDSLAWQTVGRICDACPVRESCVESAMKNGERYGWWGGSYNSRRDAGMEPPPRHERDWVLALRGCGTADGFRRHITDGEAPCRECSTAWGLSLRRRGLRLGEQVRSEAS